MDDALSRREQDDLLRHIGECPACAALLAEYRRGAALLSRLPAAEPSPALREAVLASLGPRTTVRQAWRLVAAGAALLLALGVATLGRGVPLFGAAQQPALTPAGTVASSGGYAAELEGREMLEALRRSLPERDRLVLPRRLPPGARVENVTLTRDGEAGGLNTIDVAFRIADGRLIRVRQTPDGVRSLPAQAAVERVVIDGREWRYLPRPAKGSQEAAVNLLIGEVDGRRLELESSLPLEELVKVIESLW